MVKNIKSINQWGRTGASIQSATWTDYNLPIEFTTATLSAADSCDSRDQISGVWFGRNGSKSAIALYLQVARSAGETQIGNTLTSHAHYIAIGY